jgi:hypothetical protein
MLAWRHGRGIGKNPDLYPNRNTPAVHDLTYPADHELLPKLLP